MLNWKLKNGQTDTSRDRDRRKVGKMESNMHTYISTILFLLHNNWIEYSNVTTYNFDQFIHFPYQRVMESVSTTTPLLPEISPEVADNSATAILVLSTVVAVAGSYAFGSAVSFWSHTFYLLSSVLLQFNCSSFTLLQVGFSSPAQPGIVDDLGLTVAEVSQTSILLTQIIITT